MFTSSKMHNGTTQDFSYETLNLALATTASSLSIFGTTIILCTYALWPDLRTNSRKIITFISVGDFLTALTNLFGMWDKAINNTTALCEIEALVNICAVLPSFFWTVYLSLYLYLAICKKISHESERRVMRAFHLTAWGIPLILAVLAAGFRAVGKSQNDYASAGWCWVRESASWKEMVLWMIVFGKGWEILAYFAITLFYVLIKMHIGGEMKSGCERGSSFLTIKALDVAKKADRKFTFIPVVFILLRMWGTIRFLRFLTCLPECHHIGASFQAWLFVLQGIGDSSQGFANFVLFCVCTDKIRQRFKRICFKNKPRKPSNEFESESLFECNSANSCYGTKSTDCNVT